MEEYASRVVEINEEKTSQQSKNSLTSLVRSSVTCSLMSSTIMYKSTIAPLIPFPRRTNTSTHGEEPNGTKFNPDGREHAISELGERKLLLEVSVCKKSDSMLDSTWFSSWAISSFMPWSLLIGLKSVEAAHHSVESLLEISWHQVLWECATKHIHLPVFLFRRVLLMLSSKWINHFHQSLVKKATWFVPIDVEVIE